MNDMEQDIRSTRVEDFLRKRRLCRELARHFKGKLWLEEDFDVSRFVSVEDDLDKVVNQVLTIADELSPHRREEWVAEKKQAELKDSIVRFFREQKQNQGWKASQIAHQMNAQIGRISTSLTQMSADPNCPIYRDTETGYYVYLPAGEGNHPVEEDNHGK